MHFFLPAEVFPMIEVVRAGDPRTAVEVAVAAVKRAGREPISLQRAVNGYLINRLQRSILHEAYHLIEVGIATADVIDRVAKRLLGPRMCIAGLLEQKRFCAGLEMHTQAQRSIVPTLSHRRLHPAAAGHGRSRRRRHSQRQGFYDWRGQRCRHGAAAVQRRLQRLLAFLEGDDRRSQAWDE